MNAAMMTGVGLGGFIVLALVYLVAKMAIGAANAGQNATQQMFRLGKDEQPQQQQQPQQQRQPSISEILGRRK